ncbi:MAG: porin [Geobacter sp.]|nr:porin [Geobacter sp.]
MKKRSIGAVLFLLALGTAVPSQAAFVIGGENGWQLSTDGIVNVFTDYRTTSALPAGNRFMSFLGNNDQGFGVEVGLLPSVVGFNIKAPTVGGVDSTVRIGIYPSIQNNDSTGSTQNRFETNPNIDFREIYYTAKGKYGELLAGRALNLYQGKNILTDMTLLTAGVVPGPSTSTTLGHIGYGYLYTDFGPQIRYTTPDMNGVKVALSVNEPYKVSSDTAKTNTPRIETEISYATVLSGGTTFQTWASGLYQSATRSATAAARPGEQNQSIGGAAGVEVGCKKASVLASGYYGQGLGMISAQDGDAFGSSSTDGAGEERTQWGFLAQASYKLTDDLKLGVNYGQSRQEKSDFDKNSSAYIPMKKQEAAVVMASYNFNKYIQFIGEYTYAQNTWHDGATQHSNSVAVGTLFFW